MGSPVPGLDLGAPPFDLLDEAQKAQLSRQVDLGFHPAGTRLIAAGAPSTHVHVILKGLVHASDPQRSGDDARFADYGPGEHRLMRRCQVMGTKIFDPAYRKSVSLPDLAA